MKEYEVIVIARTSEFFPAEDEERAMDEGLSWVPEGWFVDDIEVIEL